MRLIALASQTITLIEHLTTQDRKKLAVLLIAKNRAA
jgi:hypothetical protein